MASSDDFEHLKISSMADIAGGQEYEHQNEAIQGEDGNMMQDGTPLTAQYSFLEVFTAYRTRCDTMFDALEVEMRRMDELAKNHEADMSEKSTHIREYAAKLDLQEAQANDFKEKMLRFAMDWQSFSQGAFQDTGGVVEAGDSEE